MGDVPQLLANLAKLSEKLARESAALNDVIANQEATLAGLKLGLAADVRLHLWHSEDGEESATYLSYRKDLQGWGLYVYEELNGEAQRATRLRDAARDDRVDAVRAFPKLLEALEKVADQTVTDIREVTKDMR